MWKMSEFAPIVQISYNRANVLHETLLNLARCEGIQNHDIYAYVDGPRNAADSCKVAENVQVLKNFRGSYLPQMEIIQRKYNLGCLKNMYESVSAVLNRFGKAIIIEDDILVSRTFLRYVDAGLRLYAKDKRIWAINGYLDFKMKIKSYYHHDIFLAPRHSAWGWGTWKDRWEDVDFTLSDFEEFISDTSNLSKINGCGRDMLPMLRAQYLGRLNTWDVQCTYHMVKNGLFSVRPCLSLVKNIGTGTSCEHCVQYNVCCAKQKYFNFLPVLESDIQTDIGLLEKFSRLRDLPCFPLRVLRKGFHVLRTYLGSENRAPSPCMR